MDTCRNQPGPRRTGARPASSAVPGGPGQPASATPADGQPGRPPFRRHGFVRHGPGGGRGGRGPAGRCGAPGTTAWPAGVAAGLAARTGLDVTIVRIAFVLATLLTGGFGAAAYVLAWLLMPAAGEDSNIASQAMTDRRGIALAAGLASLLGVGAAHRLACSASAGSARWAGRWSSARSGSC